ncbi:DUF4003 family protein [Clostridium sp.]|uniref:DUF4003 family protein n=1 Tax=Clostridium sp. TaxID=1506 RepID=UPI002612EAB6|nr:DUF4003 family protein [Clostridium sp.]
MEKILRDKIDLTIKNYRCAKEELRNDGDLINHLASLLFAHYEKEIPFEKVKEIRKYIKQTSSRVSPFRGEMLYIVSLLINLDEDFEYKLIDEMYETLEILKEYGFKECDYLALVAYVITKNGRNKDKREIANKMREVFLVLKEKYKNITGEDDYLVCALWALDDIEVNTIDEFIETIYNHMTELNIKSKNSIQGLTNAIILKGSSGNMYKTIEFMLLLEKREIKIAQQFMPLLGVLNNKDSRRIVKSIEKIIDYLCEEEGEYEYYMDKGFRTIIALCINSFSNFYDNGNYLDELLSLGVYCFIKSKNKSMLEEALA